MIDPARLAALEALLVELNHVATATILPLFRRELSVEDKGGRHDFDPVTAADRGAEAAIRSLLATRHPEHGVIGEEYGEDRPEAELVWVIDPIDGTRSFVAGLPTWTTLIALRYQGKPILGSIGQPLLDEIFLGNTAGARLLCRGTERALRVRACSGLAAATIATTDPDATFDARARGAWAELRSRARVVRTSSDAYAYAMVAAGAIDLVVERGLEAWDIDAAIPVLAGAGGLVTRWDGTAVGREGGDVAIAGDRACLDEALAILRSGRWG